MGRRLLYRNFAWHFDDAYWADRRNDKVVFAKILREQRAAERQNRPLKIVKLIRALARNELWAPRLRGKTPESWKRCYNRWRLKLKSGTECKQKNSRQRPDFIGFGASAESFIAKRCENSRVCTRCGFFHVGNGCRMARFFGRHGETKMNELELRVGVGVPNAGGDGQRAKGELSTGQKLLTRKAKGKENLPPCTPYKRKAKGKETSPGSYENPSSPRARARAYARDRFAEAGAAADELIALLGAPRTADNRKLWAFYCYHYDIGLIFDLACQCKSQAKVGEINNAVSLFQKRLNENFPKATTTKAGGAR